MNLRRRGRDFAVVILTFVFCGKVMACSVCFGDPNSPMSKGLMMGIFTLLGVTTVVLASFGAFFCYLYKRSKIPPAELRIE